MPNEYLREIRGPVGPLEALLDQPVQKARAAAVFAHPHPLHGGTMHTKAVYQSTKALARIGVAVLRFNFRGVGRSVGHFDGEAEKDDFRAALDVMAERYPGVPLWAAGFSFGAWIAMTTGALDSRVELLLGVAPAVDRYDFAAVKKSTKPKFLIHGSRDEVIAEKDIRKFYSQLSEPRELVVIDDADHLFDGKTTELADAIEDLLRDWKG